jgi:fluoroacetyl-CoA thioesterase
MHADGDAAAAGAVGARLEREFVAEGRHLTTVGGTISAPVLSTPAMIGEMERTAAMLARRHLAADQATVGFEVCIRHVAGAGEGARCTASAVVAEVVDGRKWRFEVEVREGDRVLGLGTHERRVVAGA